MAETPEPHFIPGYTGHCPQARFRAGDTYGRISHKLFTDPCVNHGPNLILNNPNIYGEYEYPTPKQIHRIQLREKLVEPVYRHPIIPGYAGFIPNKIKYVGHRFCAAATAGVAEHSLMMDLFDCERRNLIHSNILESDQGHFNYKVGERLMPTSHYRAPLIQVGHRSRVPDKEYCPIKKEKTQYSKFTVPHFMARDDKEKWIVSGYGGHIPYINSIYGNSSKELTRRALCEFYDNYQRNRLNKWCDTREMNWDSECPENGRIYFKEHGLLPEYGGHIPGHNYKVGLTYGSATKDAKGWLEQHKDKTRIADY